MYQIHAGQTLFVRFEVRLHPVHVYLNLLAPRRNVDQNVLVIASVLTTLPALIRSAEILVPELVDLMPNVTSLVMLLCVHVTQAIQAIH